jgi:predicted RNase H-like HicB family nuclease
MRFTAAVTQEPPWYVALCLEVDFTSQGESVEDALKTLREAIELYFEGQPFLDRIDTPIIAPVDIPA